MAVCDKFAVDVRSHGDIVTVLFTVVYTLYCFTVNILYTLM